MIRRLLGSGRRVAILVGAVVLALAVGGVTVAAVSAQESHPSAHPSASASATAHPREGDAGRIQDPVPEPSATPVGVPVHVQVPAIGAASDLETLHTYQGKLIPPAHPADAGWYAAGIVPGQIGPAIIAGHIDYSAGAGIFEHLDQLKVGDTAMVTMSTGQVLTFQVTGSEEAPKAQFPTSSVYGTTPDAQLRLITCAGIVDPSTHLYRDNLVVFLKLVS